MDSRPKSASIKKVLLCRKPGVDQPARTPTTEDRDMRVSAARQRHFAALVSVLRAPGQIDMVSKRRRLLDYLKQYDTERYKQIIQKLGIRK